VTEHVTKRGEEYKKWRRKGSSREGKVGKGNSQDSQEKCVGGSKKKAIDK
jgi:hypothetical protein